VHVWVFTPATFARICRLLVENGLLSMACANFFDTARNELEFLVHMQQCADVEFACASWARMEAAAAPLPADQPAASLQVRAVPSRLHRAVRRVARLLS
jgi:hypothetical protein